MIVAELGINHNGKLETALRMVEAAAQAGADAVKTQYHIPDKEMIRCPFTQEIYDTIQSCALTDSEERKIQQCAKDNGVEYFSTPFCTEAVDALVDMRVERIKVGSGEVSNHVLLRRVAETGLPVFLSTGMHMLNEIGAAVKLFDEVTVFHCVSEYPTPYQSMQLGKITFFINQWGKAGYSSHNTDFIDTAMATALGASVIEKHFMIDHCPDAHVSLDPAGFKAMVDAVRCARKAMMPGGMDLTVRQWAAHGLYAKRDIALGEVFTDDNVTAMRPVLGRWNAAHPFHGKRAERLIRAGDPL